MNKNPDILTREHGSHPVGTSMGATSAGIIGTVAGVGLAGPLGAIVGAALGGLVGHEAAEYVNPTYEAIEPQMQSQFETRPSAQGRTYEDYRSAYAFGATEHARLRGRVWDEALEAELRSRWENEPRNIDMSYLNARDAIRDSWEASREALPASIER